MAKTADETNKAEDAEFEVVSEGTDNLNSEIKEGPSINTNNTEPSPGVDQNSGNNFSPEPPPTPPIERVKKSRGWFKWLLLGLTLFVLLITIILTMEIFVFGHSYQECTEFVQKIYKKELKIDKKEAPVSLTVSVMNYYCFKSIMIPGIKEPFRMFDSSFDSEITVDQPQITRAKNITGSYRVELQDVAKLAWSLFLDLSRRSDYNRLHGIGQGKDNGTSEFVMIPKKIVEKYPRLKDKYKNSRLY